jgi:6-phosphogluconolactonase
MSSGMSARKFIAPDEAAAADACAQHVIASLDAALSAREFATMAVSGGSTPKLLFARLAASAVPWNRVHIFWVDERCVPPTDAASNYKLANEYLIQPAAIPPQNVHRVFGEMPPDDGAKRYADDIAGFFDLQAGEMPAFDVLHRGMGPDAHTASLFPGDPLIDNRDGIAAAVYVPKLNSWRVTLLPGVLLAAKHTVVLAAGADKADAVRGVFGDEYDPKKYPSQIGLRSGDVSWFLDEKAATGQQRAPHPPGL